VSIIMSHPIMEPMMFKDSSGSADSMSYNPDKYIVLLVTLMGGGVMYVTRSYLCGVLVVLLVLIPIPWIFVHWLRIQRKLLFHAWLYKPAHPFTNPELFGLRNGVNRWIKRGAIELGCWYVNDKSAKTVQTKKVVIYCHGSSGSRGNFYRVDLANWLSSMGCVVYSFDYRGYGDSVGEATEANMIEDTLLIHEVARREHPDCKIVMYGHSMGTGVACLSTYKLQKQGVSVDGVLLEAPFLSMPDAIKDYAIFNWINNLWLYTGFVEKIADPFRTKLIFDKLEVPILIMFAEDDDQLSLKHPLTLHKLCPTSKLVLEKNGGHNHLLSQVNCRNAVCNFLEIKDSGSYSGVPR